MATALPVDARRSEPSSTRSRVSGPPPGTPAGIHFAGIRQVGTFFFDSESMGGNTSCTGSVVHTPTRDLVLTAGHCALALKDSALPIFVPKYKDRSSAADQPYGIFPMKEEPYVDDRYTANSKGADSDLDLAFVRVGPNDEGRLPEQAVGALNFMPTTGYSHRVRVIGYPGKGTINPGHQPIYCDVTTSRAPRFHQMKMYCKGYFNGVSGGPWIENGTDIIGSVGGYNGGGDDANDDWVTYAPIYGYAAVSLFHRAIAGRTHALLARL
ncbi:trypsin-like peptidase domain-containing protein [Spirillospora sp. NPDC049652]